MADWKDYNIQDEPAKGTPLNTVTAEYLNGMSGAVKTISNNYYFNSPSGTTTNQFVMSGDSPLISDNYAMWTVRHYTIKTKEGVASYGSEYGVYLLIKVGGNLQLIPISRTGNSQCELVVSNNNLTILNRDGVWRRHSYSIIKN